MHSYLFWARYTHTQDIYIYASSCTSSTSIKNLISHLGFSFQFLFFGWVWFQKIEVMVDPQSPIPPHLYPQAVQLKLYQAFIFSIPILFSIILFLLFYLFYLKRRASSLTSSSPMVLPVSSIQQPSSHLPSVSVSIGILYMQKYWITHIKK